MWLHLLAISSLSLRFFAIQKDIVLSMLKMKREIAHCTMHHPKAIFKYNIFILKQARYSPLSIDCKAAL